METRPTCTSHPARRCSYPAGTMPTVAGYTYYGWNTASDGSGTNYDPDTTITVTSDITLYERGAKGYAITFNKGNGTTGTATVLYTDPNGFLTLPDPSTLSFTASGYTFAGWSTYTASQIASLGAYSDRYMDYIGEKVQYTGATTLYAYWISNSSISSYGFDHIDVRVNGSVLLESKVNGQVVSSQTYNLTVNRATVIYGSSSTMLTSTNVTSNGTEIRFTGLNLTLDTPIRIIADVTVTNASTGATVKKTLSFTMSRAEKQAAAAECPGVGTSSAGFDFILNSDRITSSLTKTVVFKDYDGDLIQSYTGVSVGSSVTKPANPTRPNDINSDGSQNVYTFNSWVPQGSDYTISDISNVKKNMVFVASYDCVTSYKITTNVTNGTINPDADPWVASGGSQTITYSPNAGYHLVSVTVDGSAVSTTTYASSYAFTNVQANHTISVVYAINAYTITTSVVGGTITPTDSNVSYGSNKTITYSPTTGYHLVSVTVDGSAVSTTTYASSYAFTNVTANHTVAVVYAIDTYTITTSVVGGTITPTDSNVSYGSNKTITYSPTTGYHLVSVTVDGSAVSTTTYASSYTFSNVQANHTIAVVYAINTYTITTSVVGGTITPTDSSVNYGSNKTITYSPNTGYHLVSVTVDGSAVSTTTYGSSYAFTNVQANHTIAVVYAINTYTITTNVTNGTINPDADPTVNYGADQTVTYAPNTGYHLVSVTVDGSAVSTTTYGSSYAFTNVQANHTISVVYAINTYTITTSVVGGTITPTDSSVNYGSNKTITYSPNAGYHLVSVTVDGSAVSTTTYASSYAFTNVTANHTIAVVYAINTYTITTNVTNGTINPDADPTVNYGADQTVTYAPNTGYHLVSVTVDGSAVSTTTYGSSYAFTNVQANHTISVVYAINTYTITTSVVGGTITPTDSSVNYGSNKTITYSPNAGYHLVSVTVDGSAVSTTTYASSYAFTNVTANHTIAVVYAINTYTITTNVTNGTINPDADPTVNYGADQTVTYSPNTGYHLVSVTVDGTAVSTTTYGSSYAFTNVQANHTIAVVYAINTYTITTNVTNGTINPDADPTVNYGADQTVTYSPNTGYHLVSVTVDGSAVSTTTYGSSYAFTNVQANHTISVVYAINTYAITTNVTNGTINPDADPTVNYGADQTVTYSPNTGYHLVSVTVDGTAVSTTTYGSSYAFTNVQANHTIAVVYAINTYTITTNVTNGTINPDADPTVNYGADQTVTYSPNTGYHLVSVTVDGSAVSTTTYGSSYAFTNVQANHTISVVYAINTYAITTSVVGGTITPSDSNVSYGSNKTITYSPTTGYHLVSVTVDGSAVSTTTYASSYAFTNVTANHTIAVVYAINTYAVTTSVVGGTITPSDLSVNYGSNKTITYSPNTGYHLVSVTVDNSTDATSTNPSSYPFTNVTANHTIAVVYAINTYAITTGVVGGTITPTDSNVSYGSNKTITYAPNTGYHLVSVTVDGTTDATSTNPSSYPFTNVTANHTISVVYAPNDYTVTYVLNPAGLATAPAQLTAKHVNDNINVAAIPPVAGFTFTGWAYADDNNANGTDPASWNPGSAQTMPAANVTLTATYTAIPYTLKYQLVDNNGNNITAASIGATPLPADQIYTVVSGTTDRRAADSSRVHDHWLERERVGRAAGDGHLQQGACQRDDGDAVREGGSDHVHAEVPVGGRKRHHHSGAEHRRDAAAC